jgi:hypothetical protein
MSAPAQAPAQAPATEPVAVPVRSPAARPAWSSVPQVNLLPPEILTERSFRRLQRRLAAITLGVLTACGAALIWAQAGVAAAESDLASVRAQGVHLQAQQRKYAGVPTALAELDQMKGAREAVLGTDVAWYRFLADLAYRTPSDTELQSVTITMTGSTAPSASAVPLTPAGLGTVEVSGKALRFTDVAAWLDAVNGVNGLTGSGLQGATRQGGGAAGSASGGAGGGQSAGGSTGSTGSGSTGSGSAGSGSTTAAGQVTFTGSAVIVPAALSHRYNRRAS